MTSEAGGAVTLLVGAITLRLALTGDYKRYVKPGMGPLLVIAGLVLVLLGAAVVVQALRGSPAVDGADEDRGHEPERVGWLVLLPVLAVLLVAPPALGAFAVDRTSRIEVTGGALFDPLPVTDAPRALGVVEFLQRAADRDGASMAGATRRADRLRRRARGARLRAGALHHLVLRRRCRRRGGRVADDVVRRAVTCGSG